MNKDRISLVVMSPCSISNSAIPVFIKINMKINYLSLCALFSPFSYSSLYYRRVKLHRFRSNIYLETSVKLFVFSWNMHCNREMHVYFLGTPSTNQPHGSSRNYCLSSMTQHWPLLIYQWCVCDTVRSSTFLYLIILKLKLSPTHSSAAWSCTV